MTKIMRKSSNFPIVTSDREKVESLFRAVYSLGIVVGTYNVQFPIENRSMLLQ